MEEDRAIEGVMVASVFYFVVVRPWACVRNTKASTFDDFRCVLYFYDVCTLGTLSVPKPFP